VIKNYADPATIGTFTVPEGEFKTAIAGKDITVEIQGQPGRTVSLAYVHYLRQALQAVVGNGKNVAINSDLTPVFNDKDWWAANNSNQTVTNLYGDYSTSTYSDFNTGGIEIMNGIKIFKHVSDNKYMIAYNRPIKTSKVALGAGNIWGVNYPFHGFGLKKEANGTISPENGNIEIYGGKNGIWNYDDNIISFTVYETFLKEAGLYPSATLKPDHSKIAINALGTDDKNIMSNGIYDFILWYYNPAPSGATANDEALAELIPG
jgi:hypothetical protein